MKEETKKKLCKISKIVGFAITFGFAVFGVLCAAMLIANGSGAKDDIKTLDSSLVQNEVRSERNIKPRKAPDFEGAYNYIDSGTRLDVYYDPVGSNGAKFEGWPGGYAVYFKPGDLPTGYYYLAGMAQNEYSAGMWGPSSDLDGILAVEYEEGVPRSSISFLEGYSMAFNTNSPYYFYIDWAGHNNDLLWFRYPMNLYLADTLEIPSEDILELPDNWSPLRMVAKNVNKENNLIFGTDWNYWTDVPQANGQPMLDLSTILFRNQGRIYNHIYIYFKNLNGLKYATNSENIGTGNSTDWCADRVEYAFVLGDSLKYNYLASSVGTSILQGETVFNLGLNWSNPSARKLEILDKRYPSNTAIGNTLLGRFPRNGTNSLDPVTGQTIRPFGWGVWDYEYLLEYSNVSSIDFVLGGSSDVFALLTGAFNGLLPIFNVQILPNITLGILLFLPLIGGIIVIIIRVIKK